MAIIHPVSGYWNWEREQEKGGREGWLMALGETEQSRKKTWEIRSNWNLFSKTQHFESKWEKHTGPTQLTDVSFSLLMNGSWGGRARPEGVSKLQYYTLSIWVHLYNPIEQPAINAIHCQRSSDSSLWAFWSYIFVVVLYWTALHWEVLLIINPSHVC